MKHDPVEFYRTLTNEELKATIRRYETRAENERSQKAWMVALTLAKAAAEVLEEREGR